MRFSSVLVLLWFMFPTILTRHEEKLYTPISSWSKCDNQCKTYRNVICLKFSQCGLNIIREDAYCYQNEMCKKHVMNQIDGKSATSVLNNKRKRYAVPSQAKCKRSQNTPISLKILGGTLSKKNKWPWHVALINDFKEVYCAGTLISPRWVITAAHCIRKSLIVRINEFDLYTRDRGEEEVRISRDRIYIHSNFNQHTVDSDIALLKLPKPFQLPVACLPTTKPKTNRLCSIMGWGKANMKSEYGTRFLHEAQVSVMGQKKCKYSYREFILTKNMFCAGVRSGRVDTCGGDSGGGLICPRRKSGKKVYYSIDGITSFGDGCGIKEKYGIYTLVYNFVPWIKWTIYMNT